MPVADAPTKGRTNDHLHNQQPTHQPTMARTKGKCGSCYGTVDGATMKRCTNHKCSRTLCGKAACVKCKVCTNERKSNMEKGVKRSMGSTGKLQTDNSRSGRPVKRKTRLRPSDMEQLEHVKHCIEGVQDNGLTHAENIPLMRLACAISLSKSERTVETVTNTLQQKYGIKDVEQTHFGSVLTRSKDMYSVNDNLLQDRSIIDKLLKLLTLAEILHNAKTKRTKKVAEQAKAQARKVAEAKTQAVKEAKAQARKVAEAKAQARKDMEFRKRLEKELEEDDEAGKCDGCDMWMQADELHLHGEEHLCHSCNTRVCEFCSETYTLEELVEIVEHIDTHWLCVTCMRLHMKYLHVRRRNLH